MSLRSGARFALVTVLASMTFALPTAAHASGGGDGCNPDRQSDGTLYFAGGNQHTGAIIGGVRAELKNYSPWVSPNEPDGTSAWMMLLDDATTSYAQLGWVEKPGGGRYVLELYNDPDNVWWHTDQVDSDSINSYSTFRITYAPTATTYPFSWWFDGTRIDQSRHDWAPQWVDLEGEIQTKASQMPGAVNNHMYFANMEIYTPAGGGSWHSPSLTMKTASQPPSAAHPQAASLSWVGTNPSVGGSASTQMQIWDRKCDY